MRLHEGHRHAIIAIVLLIAGCEHQVDESGLLDFEEWTLSPPPFQLGGDDDTGDTADEEATAIG